jgi:CRISPR-associated protein Cmr1
MHAQQRSDAEAALDFATAPEYPGGGADVLTLALDIHLVSTLYGGGTIAGHPDEITPFRPSSVRGQLRFWWRATRGAACRTWQELRAREAEIWGDSERQSPVRIRVDCPPAMRPKRVPLSKYEKDFNRRYGLFPPYEEKNKNLALERLQEGGGFQLHVSLHQEAANLRDDIEAALWGWLNFGGLGARTRRGAGALYCPQYAGWDPAKIACDGRPRDWPTMSGGAVLWGGQPLPWRDCWDELLRFYREFRQDRTPKGRGRSNWPEADQIRAISERGENPTEGFPRGMLGLPILFHFKDRWDPPDHMLNVDEREGRMASPVILRPFAISKQQALPCVVVLSALKPRSLHLFQGKSSRQVTAGGRDAIAELIRRAEARWQTSQVRL